MEIQGWQFKVTLLCLFCCKHGKRGDVTYSSGLLDWINRCFEMQSYNGIWGCYLVINSVNNKASLKAFKGLRSSSGRGLWERLAEIITNISAVSGRRAVEECQLISSGFVFAMFTLFVWAARLKFKNQSAGYNGCIFIMVQGASSVFHSCIIHTSGWANKWSTTACKSQDICTT